MNIDKNILLKLRSLPRHQKAEFGDFIGQAGDAAKKQFDAITSAQNRTAEGAALLNGQLLNMAKGLNDAGKNARFLDERNKDLNKTFGLTIGQAASLGGTLDKLSVKFNTGGKDLRKYAGNLKGVIGNFVTAEKIGSKFGVKLLQNQRIITDSLQLSNEQANAFELYSSTIADSGADQLMMTNAIAKEIEAATGQQGLFKEIVGDIGSLTSDLQIQYGRIPGQLELGLVKAKALGLTMANLNKSGDSLLNIESSIGDELEYQLLSGRRLLDDDKKSLTNKFRTATLQGNASDQADALNEILEKEGETLKTNLFARKQMSKLLGMDEAALSRSLQKRSILESLPGGDALFDKTGDELLSAAKAMGATEEEIKELAAAEDTRTTDQKISDTLDKMVTSGIVATIKDPVATATGVSESQLKAMQSFAKLSESMSPAIAENLIVMKQAAGVGAKLITFVSSVAEMISEPGKFLKEAFANAADKFVDLDANMDTDVAEDYMVRSNGTKVSFSSQDDVLGIKPGGPVDKLLAGATGGGGATAAEIGAAVAAALIQSLPKVNLKVEGDPTFSGGGMNIGQYT